MRISAEIMVEGNILAEKDDQMFDRRGGPMRLFRVERRGGSCPKAVKLITRNSAQMRVRSGLILSRKKLLNG
jgi:hypothetical protein